MLFLINLKKLREMLAKNLFIPEIRITIKRKKKMMLEKMSNGNVKAKRKSYIKIEIIE